MRGVRVALRQEMKNNATKIRTSKILRKPEIHTDDRETSKSRKSKWPCHKIHHRWEGRRSPINQIKWKPSHYFFSEWREKTVTGERRSRSAKPTDGTPREGGIYIGRPLLTHPTSPPRAKIFPLGNCARDWLLQKFLPQEFDQNSPLLKKFHLGIGPKFFPL